MEIELATQCGIPVSVKGVVPDKLRHLTLDQAKRIPIEAGVQQAELGEVFDLRGDPGSGSISWLGDLNKIDDLGFDMKSGTMIVHSNAGNYVGRRMSGGEIVVAGSAGFAVGSEMVTGIIRIQGDCGSNVGSALPGGTRGMQGGTILVGGDVGEFAGYRQRGGLIAIGGMVEKNLGYQMLAGTIMVVGKTKGPIGLDMVRGTIICRTQPQKIGHHFVEANSQSLVAVRLIQRYLEQLHFDCRILGDSDFRIYSGDLSNQARGELLISIQT